MHRVPGSHQLQRWDLGPPASGPGPLLSPTWRRDPSASDIWQPPLETCSNLFIWPHCSPIRTDIWWPLKHVQLASRWSISYWNVFFCFEDFRIPICFVKVLFSRSLLRVIDFEPTIVTLLEHRNVWKTDLVSASWIRIRHGVVWTLHTVQIVQISLIFGK